MEVGPAAENAPDAPASPDELIWCYPGAWFGMTGVVPTVQLKWMRRAQQDFEYLWLARQRGQQERAAMLARLVARPVEMQPAQAADPIFSLLSGTADGHVWDQAADLVARTLALSEPGQAIDPAAERQLGYDMTSWSSAQQRPLLLGRSTEWGWGPRGGDGRNWVSLRFGVDVYSAIEQEQGQNKIEWTALPEGWDARGAVTEVPRLSAGHVARFPMVARIDLNQVTAATRRPVRLTFEDGFNSRRSSTQFVVPVAVSERRQGPPPVPDGSLGDWAAEDALHEGQLVKMLNRPALQRQELQLASTPVRRCTRPGQTARCTWRFAWEAPTCRCPTRREASWSTRCAGRGARMCASS